MTFRTRMFNMYVRAGRRRRNTLYALDCTVACVRRARNVRAHSHAERYCGDARNEQNIYYFEKREISRDLYLLLNIIKCNNIKYQ